MFVVLLRFSAGKSKAPQWMEAHNAWIKRGFDEGVFLMTGSLQPGLGGAVLAHNVSLDALSARVSEDPFVAHDVVSAEILHISPGRAEKRLAFLLE